VRSKPVLKQMKILRLLLTQDIGVNTIFKQTGLAYKKAVTDAISELEKAQLLGEREDPNHSQREIKYLTDSGKEVADMIISLDEYAKSIYKLYVVAKEKVLFVTGRYLGILDLEDVEEEQLIHIKRDFRNALRILGWQHDEIAFYNSCRTNVVDLISFCERDFLNVLLLRYSLILHSFKLNNKAKTIISNIILNAMNEKVSFMLDNIQDETLGYSTMSSQSYSKEDANS
jgi:DNA-binding HxlR family transcriptional regulator